MLTISGLKLNTFPQRAPRAADPDGGDYCRAGIVMKNVGGCIILSYCNIYIYSVVSEDGDELCDCFLFFFVAAGTPRTKTMT